MAERYLITGASGFVGSNLVHALVDRGDEVAILARASSNLWRVNDKLPSIKVIEADLRDRERVKKIVGDYSPTVVYHSAAYGCYHFQDDSSQMTEVNILGTLNILDASRSSTLKRFVHFGSSGEYGRKDHPMREDDLMDPFTPYALTKMASTQFCRFVGRSSKEPVVALRLFSPYGPFEEPTRLVPAIVSTCLGWQDIKLTGGSEARDFLYIDDVVRLALDLVTAEVEPGEVFNVGSGKQRTVREIVEKVIELTKSDFQPQWGTVAPRDYDLNFWQADLTHITSRLGWEPKISIEEGLRKTIEWQRSRGPVPSVKEFL